MKKERLEFIGVLVGAVVVLIGIVINLLVSCNNHELTKKIATKQDELAKIQTVVDYIPYLSSDKKEQQKIAIVAITRILDTETAIRMGIAAGGSSEINDAVVTIGEPAIKTLEKIANETKDGNTLAAARNALKKLDKETIVFKTSSVKNDSDDYRVFRSGKIFVNLKVSNPISQFWIDWGNGKNGEGRLIKISNFSALHNRQDNWYVYTIFHEYNSLGQKNIRIKIIFAEGGKEYWKSKKIKIERIE